jgi:hypothetical protein
MEQKEKENIINNFYPSFHKIKICPFITIVSLSVISRHYCYSFQFIMKDDNCYPNNEQLLSVISKLSLGGSEEWIILTKKKRIKCFNIFPLTTIVGISEEQQRNDLELNFSCRSVYSYICINSSDNLLREKHQLSINQSDNFRKIHVLFFSFIFIHMG